MTNALSVLLPAPAWDMHVAPSVGTWCCSPAPTIVHARPTVTVAQVSSSRLLAATAPYTGADVQAMIVLL